VQTPLRKSNLSGEHERPHENLRKLGGRFPAWPGALCNSPEHHQFDFWVGDWQVFDATTHQLVGFDHVAKLAEGCIAQQNLGGQR
jgi:hypothetical protein